MAGWHIVRIADRLAIAGELRIQHAAPIWKTLVRVSASPGPRLDLDLAEAHVIDGAIMALLVGIRDRMIAHGIRSEIVGAPARIEPLVHLYRGDQPPPSRRVRVPHASSPLHWLGGVALYVVERTRAFVKFGAQLFGALVGDIRQINWRSLPSLIERAGTDGIPIIVLANFLMGFTMAYQSMAQLKLYGANIYVADIVGVSVTRELAPLMTAVMMVGRSGAAYAAELGAMHVSEEIDALRTMGFSPIAHLAAPRTIALAIAAPVLAIIGDLSGVLGGLLVAVSSLGVTAHGYVSELRTIVVASDVWTGLVKSVAFGFAIAFIGCMHGLSARGAASGVGRSTTATVVASSIAIIVIDTGFTVVFQGLGL